MVTEQGRFLYSLASDGELNDLVAGRFNGSARTWPYRGYGFRQAPGTVGVLWREPAVGSLVRPIAIVAEGSAHRRLFGRFAQVRSDFSPLSSWCHIFDPGVFATIDEAVREPDLGGMEAAWVGLAIAEAAILSNRSVSQLKLAACLATQSYAVGRTAAIWPGIPVSDILNKYEAIQNDIRMGGNQEVAKSDFLAIWNILIDIGRGGESYRGGSKRLSNAMRALRKARELGADEAVVLEAAFDDLPEARFLSGLPGASAEQRLTVFDNLVRKISEEKPGASKRAELTFLAGYLATVAAGGSASLSLASGVTSFAPEIFGWACVIGGLGENVTWSGGFSGLGRFVARELMRSFRVDEPPTSDFSADEARVLVDKQLSDPLVYLQLKQSRIVTVSLYPGLNVQVPLAEPPSDQVRQTDRRTSPSSNHSPKVSAAEDVLRTIADALAPLIIDRIRDQFPTTVRERNSKVRSPRGAQQNLPLSQED